MLNAYRNLPIYSCGITIPVSVQSIGSLSFNYNTALTTINYNGTKVQWEAIEKSSNWNNKAGDYLVHCKDGNIYK